MFVGPGDGESDGLLVGSSVCIVGSIVGDFEGVVLGTFVGALLGL